MTNVGEIITDVQAIGAGSSFTFVPATGENYILLAVCSDTMDVVNSLPLIAYGLQNSVNVTYCWKNNGAGGLPFIFQALAFDRTNYLTIVNLHGGGAVLGFAAIRVK